MHQVHLFAAIIGGLIVGFSFFEKKIQEGPVSEPLLAMIIGILAGLLIPAFPEASEWEDQLETLHIIAEASIAMALMATALRLPKYYLQQHWKTLMVLLLVVLLLMSLFAAAAFWTFLDIPLLSAFLLGAVVSPTDPVIATSIVSGPVARKRLPGSIRHTISMESGANDGLAMPLVMLPILLMQYSPFAAWEVFFVKILLWESLGAILIGGLAGMGAGKLLMLQLHKGMVTTKAFLMFSVALAFGVLAVLELSHLNGLIGVFAAGLGLNRVMDEKQEIEEERVQEAVERLFTIPVFFAFGIFLPWEDWQTLGWIAVFLPMVILIFRRIPAFFIAKRGIRNLKRTADYWFVGWFGPIGVAAIYYAILSYNHFQDTIYWVIPSLIVFSSTFLHGITSGPYTRWYQKRYHFTHEDN